MVTIITSDLTWDLNTAQIVKKSNARMELLRKVASFGASLQDLKLFAHYLSEANLNSLQWSGQLCQLALGLACRHGLCFVVHCPVLACYSRVMCAGSCCCISEEGGPPMGKFTVGGKIITLPEKLFHQLFVCPVREGAWEMGDGGRGSVRESVRGVSPGIIITLPE